MGNAQELQKGSFTLICGRTGSGKTTMLKELKKQWGDAAGYVFQNPDNQIVADTVRQELAYGLANLGLPQNVIRSRVAETASYFGISRWMDRRTDTLSGGEKQILNLASVMAMNPEFLILDEPTSMLDPVMSTRLIEIILRIHRELGTTIIIAEHRPDELFGLVDEVAVIDQGEIVVEGDPLTVAKWLLKSETLHILLPVATQICSKIPSMDEIPLTIAEGRSYLHRHPNIMIEDDVKAKDKTKEKALIELRDVTFAYEKHGRKILEHMTLAIHRKEIVSLLGENGSGKSTAAMVLAGAYRPYSGRVVNHAKSVAMLFQDVTTHFVKDSYQGKHPYDYSGGEQQLLALNLVLEQKPEFLILDEPTKGLDAIEKERLAKRLQSLKESGVSILLITHDLAFAEHVSDRMALLFDGSIATCKEPTAFCEENLFYTTPTRRLQI